MEGFPRPRFEDDVWNLLGIRGRPQHLARCQLIWDFTEIVNPRWRLVVKELALACWAPAHPAVAELARAYRTPRALATASRHRPLCFDWLNWLSGQGVTSLQEVTQEHCQRFFVLRSTIRDREGRRLREASTSHRRVVITAIMDLACYGDLFTRDRYDPDFQPWQFAPPAVVAGLKKPGENTTQPVPDRILRPLLAACLYLVDVIGPHLAELHEQVQARLPRTTGGPGFHRRPTIADMARALEEHRTAGESLTEMVGNQVTTRLAGGWSPQDPLLRVSFQKLANRVGCREFRTSQLTPELRRATEETLTAVGLAKPWGRTVPSVPRADTQELVPWTEPLHTRDVMDVANAVRQAALTVTAALSGMRNSELAELLVGCRRTVEAGPGLVRRSLASKIIKGQELGGLDDEWVVLDEVHRAVALVERLHGNPESGALLFGRTSFHSTHIRALRPLVNGPFGRRLGLAPIPEGQVNLQMLRRTLALELATALTACWPQRSL